MTRITIDPDKPMLALRLHLSGFARQMLLAKTWPVGTPATARAGSLLAAIKR